MCFDFEIVIATALLLIVRVAVQAMEAPIMRIGSQLGLLGQMQFVLDSSDQFFPFQDASVGKKREPIGFRIAEDPAASVRFVLLLSGRFADLLPAFPHVDVAARIVQVITVLLALTQRSTVAQQFAIHQPENT
jgi:hypothetical protein